MTPHTQTPLSYADWLQENHNTLSGVERFYKAIGIYDVFYLYYRATNISKKIEEPTHEHPAVKRAMRKTVEKSELGELGELGEFGELGELGELRNEEVTTEKKTETKTIKKKKTVAKKVSPTKKERPKKTTKTMKKQEEPQVSQPSHTLLTEHSGLTEPTQPTQPTQPSPLLWLTAKELEDVEDLRKTDYNLGVGNIPVSFRKRSIDDEEETELHVGDKIFRVLLPSPALNLSRMAQTVKVSYGELYVLGRAALGAISGEGYISAKEAERLVQELHETEERSFTLGVSYCNKDATSSSRMESVVTLRFERTDR